MATLNIKGFPEDLYKILVALAKNERRSLTQEVIYLLENAIKKSEKQRTSILNLRGLGKKYWKGIDASGHVDKER